MGVKLTKGDWGYVYVCPTTRLKLSDGDMYHNNGLCPKCGDESSHICHRNKIKFVKYKATYGWKFWLNHTVCHAESDDDAVTLNMNGYNVVPKY
jgi:hypothetical protein